jgi:hypothetical protein
MAKMMQLWKVTSKFNKDDQELFEDRCRLIEKDQTHELYCFDVLVSKDLKNSEDKEQIEELTVLKKNMFGTTR